MLIKATFTALMATALVGGGTSIVLANESTPLSLSLEVGGEYDNNITVDTVDITSQKGDESALLDASIGYEFIRNSDIKVKAGYSFSQSLHQDLTEFDIQIHEGSLEASTKIDDITANLSYRYDNIRLGAQSFLEMHSISPNFSTVIGTDVLVMGGYEYLRQNFKQTSLQGRNANRHSGNIKTYLLLGHGRTINAGYKLSRHNTDDPELIYWGHTFDAGFKLPVELIEGAVFTTRYRYRLKKYSNITQSLGEKREDNRHSIRARLELPMFDQFKVKLEYLYIKSKSNFASLNYDDHRVSVKLAWKL